MIFPFRTNMIATLRRMDTLEITKVFGPYYRLNLREIGREWGEGQWTDRELWQ